MSTQNNIQKPAFTRSLHGYTSQEVDYFIDYALQKYDSVCKENAELKRRLSRAMLEINEKAEKSEDSIKEKSLSLSDLRNLKAMLETEKNKYNASIDEMIEYIGSAEADILSREEKEESPAEEAAPEELSKETVEEMTEEKTDESDFYDESEVKFEEIIPEKESEEFTQFTIEDTEVPEEPDDEEEDKEIETLFPDEAQEEETGAEDEVIEKPDTAFFDISIDEDYPEEEEEHKSDFETEEWNDEETDADDVETEKENSSEQLSLSFENPDEADEEPVSGLTGQDYIYGETEPKNDFGDLIDEINNEIEEIEQNEAEEELQYESQTELPDEEDMFRSDADFFTSEDEAEEDENNEITLSDEDFVKVEDIPDESEEDTETDEAEDITVPEPEAGLSGDFTDFDEEKAMEYLAKFTGSEGTEEAESEEVQGESGNDEGETDLESTLRDLRSKLEEIDSLDLGIEKNDGDDFLGFSFDDFDRQEEDNSEVADYEEPTANKENPEDDGINGNEDLDFYEEGTVKDGESFDPNFEAQKKIGKRMSIEDYLKSLDDKSAGDNK